MAANYRLNETRLTEASLIRDMKADGLDESSAGDVRTFLEKKGLHLVTLSGRLDGKPPAALEWWVESRGYPVICVINRDEQGIPPLIMRWWSSEFRGNRAGIRPISSITSTPPRASRCTLSRRLRSTPCGPAASMR